MIEKLRLPKSGAKPPRVPSRRSLGKLASKHSPGSDVKLPLINLRQPHHRQLSKDASGSHTSTHAGEESLMPVLGVMVTSPARVVGRTASRSCGPPGPGITRASVL